VSTTVCGPRARGEGGNRRSYNVEVHEHRHGGSSGRDQCALVSVAMNAQVDLLPPLRVLQGESEKAVSVFAFDSLLLFDADAHLELKRTSFVCTHPDRGKRLCEFGLGHRFVPMSKILADDQRPKHDQHFVWCLGVRGCRGWCGVLCAGHQS
jgi:hypothetical protein